MDLSLNTIAAGFFFGVWGVFLIKRSKREAHLPSLVLGAALLVFPYFVENAYAIWATGFVLLGIAYKLAS